MDFGQARAFIEAIFSQTGDGVGNRDAGQSRQPEKQPSPKLVTELGIVVLVKPEQSQNLQVVLYQRLVC